tara:strand:- start:388 stop:561 length:174 start_codon:yes stop_codon:yes gene_type:complete
MYSSELTKTPQMKTAMYGLMNEVGGSFTRNQQLRSEMLDTFGSTDKAFLNSKNKVMK